MKKQDNFRKQLGLKQEELAQLLQVTRSQLSLYEIGKRKLPIHATQKLASILSFAQKESTLIEHKDKNDQKEVNLLQLLLVKNQHQQLLLEKKMLAIQKKENAAKASEKIVTHLKEQAKTKKETKLIEAIALKNKKNEISSHGLLQLQIKKEVLVFEEKTLKKLLEIAVKT